MTIDVAKLDIPKGRELVARATTAGVALEWNRQPAEWLTASAATWEPGSRPDAVLRLSAWLAENADELLDAAEERERLVESLERGGAGRCGCDHAPCRHDAHRFLEERDVLSREKRAAEAAREAAEGRVREVLANYETKRDEWIEKLAGLERENAELRRSAGLSTEGSDHGSS